MNKALIAESQAVPKNSALDNKIKLPRQLSLLQLLSAVLHSSQLMATGNIAGVLFPII
jgi:hypothetical protein